VIFIDTSIFVAILGGEEDRSHFEECVEAADRRLTSPVVRLETCMELSRRADLSVAAAVRQFEKLMGAAGVEEVAVDAAIGRAAVECFDRFGKGRHPARLNFADCLSYAAAKAFGARLLFKGEDFARTDVNSWLVIR
jgi:ribonuclease VapC